MRQAVIAGRFLQLFKRKYRLRILSYTGGRIAGTSVNPLISNCLLGP